jgi:hypothetical protein
MELERRARAKRQARGSKPSVLETPAAFAQDIVLGAASRLGGHLAFLWLQRLFGPGG